MGKYILLYKGEPTDMSQFSEEEGKAIMDQWGVWMGKIGAALADPGAPFGPNGSVVDDGSTGTASKLNGYTIVEADDMAAAQALCDGHPFMTEGKGNYAIDIFELMPM